MAKLNDQLSKYLVENGVQVFANIKPPFESSEKIIKGSSSSTLYHVLDYEAVDMYIDLQSAIRNNAPYEEIAPMIYYLNRLVGG